jgi:hypothetical protein
MIQLRRDFTLPELEWELEGLTEGALFQISGRDYERLLGTNDVAAVRLRNFAASHACVVDHSSQAIPFRKRLERSDDRPLDLEQQND